MLLFIFKYLAFEVLKIQEIFFCERPLVRAIFFLAQANVVLPKHLHRKRWEIIGDSSQEPLPSEHYQAFFAPRQARIGSERTEDVVVQRVIFKVRLVARKNS